MIKNSLLNTGEIEVIADAVAEALAKETAAHEAAAHEAVVEEDKKASWWKKPTILIPVLTALLSSPVVLHLVSAQAEPVSPPIINTGGMTGAMTGSMTGPVPQNADFGGRERGQGRQGGQGGQGRWNNYPVMTQVTMTVPLRYEPKIKSGTVLMLEEGAALKLLKCQRTSVEIDDMEGRWCQVTYKDKQGKPHLGWVFNVYLNNDTES